MREFIGNFKTHSHYGCLNVNGCLIYNKFGDGINEVNVYWIDQTEVDKMMCQDDIFEFYGNVFDINIYEYDDKPKSGIIFSTTQQIFIKRGGMAEFNVCINHFNTKDDVLCKIQGKKIREQDIVRKDS